MPKISVLDVVGIPLMLLTIIGGSTMIIWGIREQMANNAAARRICDPYTMIYNKRIDNTIYALCSVENGVELRKVSRE